MPTIKIIVEGGVVQDVIGVPKGVTLEILDFDTDGIDADQLQDSPWGQCSKSIYGVVDDEPTDSERRAWLERADAHTNPKERDI